MVGEGLGPPAVFFGDVRTGRGRGGACSSRAPGISPSAKIRTPCAWRASSPIFGRRMRTEFRYACGVRSQTDKVSAPPTQKGHPKVSFALARVDKKDAALKMEKFLIYQGIPPLFEMFFKVF